MSPSSITTSAIHRDLVQTQYNPFVKYPTGLIVESFREHNPRREVFHKDYMVYVIKDLLERIDQLERIIDSHKTTLCEKENTHDHTQ